MIRRTILDPVWLHSILVNFKITTVTVRPDHMRLLQKTDMVSLFQILRCIRSLVLVKGVHFPGGSFCTSFVSIYRRKRDFFGFINLIMAVFKVL